MDRLISFTKTRDAQPAGVYQPTEVDRRKAEADFRLTQVSPYVIVWRDGRVERVTKRRFNALAAQHTCVTDF